MADFSNLAEPKFSSWAELSSELLTHNIGGFIFRGLASYDYSPISSLERALRAAGIQSGDWSIRENAALAFFKDRARHHIAMLPADNDLLGWWSLMQHYGAPTRLVDWTVSPFVACYFAYERPVPDKKSAALWMLNARVCREPFGSNFPFGRDHIGATSLEEHQADGTVKKSYPGRSIDSSNVAHEENELVRNLIANKVSWPLPIAILQPDKRMSAQQACFVCSGELDINKSAVEAFMKPMNNQDVYSRLASVNFGGKYISSSGGAFWADDGNGGHVVKSAYEIPGFVVQKIELPYEWRDQVLHSLARMNITADTLFPGLDGVGRAADIYLQTGAPSSMREYIGL